MEEQQNHEMNITRQGDIASAAITVNSTAPTALVAGGYRLSKNGKTCRLAVFAEYTNAGATNTTATFNLATVMADIPGIVSQFNKVGGQCVANDSAIGTALLDKDAETIVATFASASLTKIEAHFVFECE
jgi:hypothetical protein